MKYFDEAPVYHYNFPPFRIVAKETVCYIPRNTISGFMQILKQNNQTDYATYSSRRKGRKPLPPHLTHLTEQTARQEAEKQFPHPDADMDLPIIFVSHYHPDDIYNAVRYVLEYQPTEEEIKEQEEFEDFALQVYKDNYDPDNPEVYKYFS